MPKKIGREISISDDDHTLLTAFAGRQGVSVDALVEERLTRLVVAAKSEVVSAWWRGLPLSEQYRIYEANK